MVRDPAAEQLNEYKKTVKDKPHVILTGNGAPIANKTAILTAGSRGPLLIQDSVFIDEISHFDRERIPERVVHAKGAGAFGYFEVTHNITQYSRAKVFSKIGKKLLSPYDFRLQAEKSDQQIQDSRGFALKFYTEEGIWDLVGNNTPLLFVKDSLLFPSLIHVQKRNPVTFLKDNDMFWDFLSLRPESTHQLMFLFGDRGIPDGYRHMHGFGANTFKLVNKENEFVWCKFHYKTDQGIKNLDDKKAAEISSHDPDYGIRDLYNAIAKKKYPSWTFYIQVMSEQQADKFRWNPFDATKVWPHKEFPLIPVGKLVLNKNPTNYFAEVEQLAFNPGNLVPGIEPSPDKLLQGRLLSYGDTQRHRLGPNHLQIPVNCPFKIISAMNYERDGTMTIYDQNGAPNYYPNSFKGPEVHPDVQSPPFGFFGDADRYEPVNEDNFGQATTFWHKVLDADAKTRFVSNVVASLSKASTFIIERAVRNFSQVDVDLVQRLTSELRKAGKLISVSGKSANL